MQIWNFLCDVIAEGKKNNWAEDAFQEKISHFIETALYWSSITNSIRVQYFIGFAHTKGRADIVLVNESQHIEVIIELKRPNHFQKEDDVRQLFDYMKVSNCLFGLYIGEKLELYYNEPSNIQNPKLVSSIVFTKNNTCGKELLDLLVKPAYSVEKLEKYCERQIELQKVVKYWTSPKGKKELLDFVVMKSNLDESCMGGLHGMMDIKVVDLSSCDSSENVFCSKKTNGHEAKPHDNTMYSLDNDKFLSKRAFAFYVIKRMTEQNPSMTFEDISLLVKNKSSIIRKKTEWELLSLDARSRYCDNEDEILMAADGVEFLVSDQWTKKKIEDIIISICNRFQWKVYTK